MPRSSEQNRSRRQELNDIYLFRGKNRRYNDWVQGFLFAYSLKGWCIGTHPLSANDYGEIYCCDYKEIDPATIGQWTGLWDSTKWKDLTPKEQEFFADGFEDERCNCPQEHWKGKQIFEDDIVRMEAYIDNYMICVIRRAIDGPMFIAEEENGKGWVFFNKQNVCKVIGNVYDNPELIKESEYAKVKRTKKVT